MSDLMKPCLRCGEPAAGGRCVDHPKPVHSGTPNVKHPAYANNGRWKRLSQRLRKQQRFCELCGSTDNLTVDHIVRFTDRPEWAYEPANLRVICKPDNDRLAQVPASKDTERMIEHKINTRGRPPAPSPAPTPPGSRGDHHTFESFQNRWGDRG